MGDRRQWPRWQPTHEMIERDLDACAQTAHGLPGGIDDPLEAKSPYPHDAEGGDTCLRIRGTNDPRPIGSVLSNGRARLANDHFPQLHVPSRPERPSSSTSWASRRH